MRIEVVRMWPDPDILYTKGHVDIVEFRRAAEEYATNDTSNSYFQVGTPYYTWLRKSPDNKGTYYYLVKNGTPGQHGTFPATVGCALHWGHRFREWDRMPEETNDD